jgi:hypothetical protein
MLDAGCLADAFEGLFNEHQPDSILTKYAEIRKEIYQKYTDPWSRANVQRLFELDPDTAINDPFMQAVHNASENAEIREQFVRRPELLKVDIKQFFV